MTSIPVLPIDARKLFWYLKRSSSVAAWERVDAAFDEFAAVYKKQMLEEPIAKLSPDATYYITEWEFSWSSITKARMLFKKGLNALRKGQRSVWKRDSLAYLFDATNLVGDWYQDLVFNGRFGDQVFYGKYVEQLKEKITVYTRAGGEAGFLINTTDVITYPLYHASDELLGATLENKLYYITWEREHPDEPANAYITRNYIKYPKDLPEVPPFTSGISVKTGEEIPVDGIYAGTGEHDVLNYFLAGERASYGSRVRTAKCDTTWNLIWEDNRYLDGTIPEEESTYFLPAPPEPVPTPETPRP